MKQSTKHSSKPKRKRNPRRIPHNAVIETGFYSTDDNGSEELATITHRARLEFTLDVKVRSLEHWIGIWTKRWPKVTSHFWRSVANRESWDIARQDVWEQYKGKALEVFIEHETKRAMYEMKAQEELLDMMFAKLKDDIVQPKSFEGMVSALVKLARLNGDQREGFLSKFANPAMGLVGAKAFRKEGDELPSMPKLDGDKKQMAKRMARFMLTGKETKIDRATRSEGGDVGNNYAPDGKGD